MSPDWTAYLISLLDEPILQLPTIRLINFLLKSADDHDRVSILNGIIEHNLIEIEWNDDELNQQMIIMKSFFDSSSDWSGDTLSRTGTIRSSMRSRKVQQVDKETQTIETVVTPDLVPKHLPKPSIDLLPPQPPLPQPLFVPTAAQLPPGPPPPPLPPAPMAPSPGPCGAPPPPPPPPPGISAGGAPPPPPPPGAPPGPGGLPPPPGGPMTSAPCPFSPSSRSKVKLKKLHWEKARVPPPSNSVWSRLQIKVSPSQRSSRSNSLTDRQSLYDEIDDAFEQKVNRTLSSPSALPTQHQRPSLIQDQKKSLNLGIYAKQFKQTPAELMKSLRQMDLKIFNIENIKALRKNTADISDELEQVKEYAKENSMKSCSLAELLLYEITKFSNFSVYVEIFEQKLLFEETQIQLSSSLTKLERAMSKLMSSKSVENFLYETLLVGNYLMDGSRDGNALAFDVSSLLKLKDVRATKNKETLLHFVMKRPSVGPDSVQEFISEEHIYKGSCYFVFVINIIIGAAGIDLKSLTEQITSEARKLDMCKQKASRCQMKDFDGFFATSTKKINQLKLDLQDVTQLSTQFIEYFGTNPKKTKLSHLLETFSTFCSQVKATDEG